MLVHGLYQLDHFGSGRDHQQIFAIYENVATPPDLYRFSSDLSNKSRVSVVDPRLGGFKLGTAKVLETRVPLYDGRIENVRSEEHTSELQSLMRISYAVFCLNKKKTL